MGFVQAPRLSQAKHHRSPASLRVGQASLSASLGQARGLMRINQRLSRDDAYMRSGPHLHPMAWAGRMGGIESCIPCVSRFDQADATRCLFERRVGDRRLKLVMAAVEIWESRWPLPWDWAVGFLTIY